LTAANARGRSRHYAYYACRAGHVRRSADLVHEALIERLREDAGELAACLSGGFLPCQASGGFYNFLERCGAMSYKRFVRGVFARMFRGFLPDA